MGAPSDRPLLLHEEILLLALRDHEGTIPCAAAHFKFALGGAMLAELFLSGRARAEGKKRKLFVELERREPLGEPVLDEALERIATSKRRGTVKTWVQRFSNTRRLKHRVARGLCSRGVLRASEDKILLLFTRRIYPEVDPAPEREVVRRLREAIFGGGQDLDPRTVALVSLLHATGLLKVVFSRKSLKERKRRIEQIVGGECVGKATKKAIEELQAAIFTAAIVPAIAAS